MEGKWPDRLVMPAAYAASLLILLARGFVICLFRVRNPNTIRHKEEYL